MNIIEARVKCLEVAMHICRARHEYDESAVVLTAEVLYAFVASGEEESAEPDKPKRGRPRRSPEEV